MSKEKQNYKYGPKYRLALILIVIFAAIGIAGGFVLFVFGMAFIFQGIYSQTDAPDMDKVNPGIVMMVLGFYVSGTNLISTFLTANGLKRRNTKGGTLLGVMAIIGIIPMVGGILILTTPVENGESKSTPESNSSTNSGGGTTSRSSNDNSFATFDRPRGNSSEQLTKKL